MLEAVAEHGGWYLAGELLGPAEVESAPDVVDDVCDRLFPHLEELVAVLDVPLEVVRSPIATDDYIAAFTRGSG